MKKLILIASLLFTSNFMFATIILVDQHGAGQYSTIQAAINVAVSGDTVRVWPGTYQEQITMNKNILLEGSGYENTIITGNFDPTISITAGTIKWFRISSLLGVGIKTGGGVITNCVIEGCSSHGIYSDVSPGYVQNCVVVNNNGRGLFSTCNSQITVVNTISKNNGSYDFQGDCNTMPRSYCDGYGYGTTGNIGCINVDPMFIDPINHDYHLSQGSPCWNTGNPSINDPDGSRSDMGFFGGPNCPIYPVVYEIQITPNGSNINLQAKGRANY